MTQGNKSNPFALVINAWVTDFKLYDEWMHPAGLYFLVDALVFSGYNVALCDLIARPYEHGANTHFSTGPIDHEVIEKPALFNDLKRRYKRYGCSQDSFTSYLLGLQPQPDIICVGTTMSYWLDGLEHTIATIRKIFPTTPLVVGGICVSLMPEHVAEVLNKYTVITAPGKLGETPGIPHLKIPDKLSFINAFKLKGLMNHAPILTSGGCPMSCSYCASRALGNTYTVRPKSLILDEIDWAVKAGTVRNFAFLDDALLWRAEEHFMPLLEAIIQKYPTIYLHAPNGMHLCYITPAIAKLMFRAGITTIRLGYESSDLRFAHSTSHKANESQLSNACSMLKKAGFSSRQIGVYVMAGLPDQTPDDVHKEIDYLQSLQIIPKVVFLSPVPKTLVFNEYAIKFPHIRTNHHWHNDTFFITQLPSWNIEAIESIKNHAKNAAHALY